MSTEPESSSEKLQRLPDRGKNSLSLGNLQNLDLEGLPEDVKIQLRAKQAESFIELQAKYAEAGMDTKIIDQRMKDLTVNAAEATREDAAFTGTGSYNDKLGHTEIIVGNTETAHKGKLSRSQRGDGDNTMLYVIIAVVAIIILAIVFNGQ